MAESLTLVASASLARRDVVETQKNHRPRLAGQRQWMRIEHQRPPSDRGKVVLYFESFELRAIGNHLL